MSKIDDLIRFESANSGLAFRAAVYGSKEFAEAVIDCLALANADLKGRSRYLIIGVDDSPGGKRRFPGIGRSELVRFARRFLGVVGAAVEPELTLGVHVHEVDNRLFGVIRLRNCEHAPYLARTSIGTTLQPGMGFIRRGATNHPLQRADMARMFAATSIEPAAGVGAGAGIQIGFHGKEPLERLSLPALPVQKLPSKLAGEALRNMLRAQEQSRHALGQTETRLSRLVHARNFGVEVPYAKHSDDSLLASLESVERDFRAADEHYLYEVRAHKLNLLIANNSEEILHGARIVVSLPNYSGMGVASRIHTESEDEAPPGGYPAVVASSRAIKLESELGTLYPNRKVRAFREPIRFWAREEAAGQSLPVRVALHADEFSHPVQRTLELSIESATLRTV